MFVKFDLGSNSVPFLRTLKINAQKYKRDRENKSVVFVKGFGIQNKVKRTLNQLCGGCVQ